MPATPESISTAGIPVAPFSLRNWLMSHPFKVEGPEGLKQLAMNLAFWAGLALVGLYVFFRRK